MYVISLLQYPFMQNALIAATFVALIAPLVGYFLLLRRLTFAGHALSHIGFAGAAGAVLLGVDPVFGLLVFTIISGIGIGIIGRRFHERDITIGIILTLALSLGVLFLFLYQGYAEEAYSILFGTILGVSKTDVIMTIIFSILTFLCMIGIYRPLLFSSFDPQVAEASGVPTQFLSILFLILLAVTVSIAVQIVGILLIFTLLVGPVATAMRLTKKPVSTIGLAIIFALLFSWMGILLAASTNLPVTFYITSLSFLAYMAVRFLPV